MRYHNNIQQIAILGAGVMGAQIAAHFANNGFKPLLFDLPAKSGKTNAIVAESIKSLARLQPQPLVSSEAANVIIPANYTDNLQLLQNCDLIIEAIAERIEWKQDLYKKITPFLKPGAILATNTSGLSIAELAKKLPDEIKPRFIGMHFFNPPRYMHLVELIPHAQTNIELINALETFVVIYLGKGVIIAKDTPNFIANRVGVFSILATMYHAKKYDLSPDMVDALTGTLIGRPKSATYRTLDIIGLDTFSYVVNTMQNNLAGDPWHFMYQLPNWLTRLIEKGALGNKTNAGIYKKIGKDFRVIDFALSEYRPVRPKIPGELTAILKGRNLAASFTELSRSRLPEAKFLLACYRDLFHYCAYHLEHIAHAARDIDFAFRWGFCWDRGPFELWRSIGWNKVVDWLNQSLAVNETLVKEPLPGWVNQVQEHDAQKLRLQKRSLPGELALKSHISTGSKAAMAKDHTLPVYGRQYFPEILATEKLDEGQTIVDYPGVRLWTLDGNNAILSFKSKKNTLGLEVLAGMQEAIARAEKDYTALILWPREEKNFSYGANLQEILTAVNNNNLTYVEKMLINFQQVTMALRYCQIPTLAAIRGLTLGGGCELMLHCDLTVATLESYVGLVETGVGVIPAGGGTKEFAKRAAEKLQGYDLNPFLQPYFNLIATADVSQSAVDAKNKGMLRPQDVIIANVHETLFVAHQYAHAMAAASYRPPTMTKFAVAGKSGIATLQTKLINLREGEFISEHDYMVASGLTKVICGGEIAEGSMVDEQWILDLEREVFLQLLVTKATQERIKFTLEQGKPLRN